MFARTETQVMMVEMADRLLTRESEFEARRARLSAADPDRMALWPALAGQGLIGVLANESQGGFGGGARDVASLMALMGEHLVVEPLLPAALFFRASGETAPETFEALIAGDASIAFAHQEGADPFVLPATTARVDGNGWRISGGKTIVRHADVTTHWLISAALEGRTALFLVAREDGAATALRLIDGSGAADLALDDAPATLIDDGRAIGRVLALQFAGLAAEACGIARAAIKRTAAYLRTRQQFGLPLAKFQALQHRLADMHIAAEEVVAVTDLAIDAIDRGSTDALALAAAAKALADTAARRVANDAVQLHGGMGVSDELDISHYFRRVAAIRAEGGDAVCLRDYAFGASGSLVGAAITSEGDLAVFREEVRAFTRDALPADIAAKGRDGLEIGKDDYVRWQKALRDKGWFAAAWPEKFGGAGWDIERQLILLQESALENAPMLIPYGVSMVGPVIAQFGDEAQQRRHLPGILSSDMWWCQGYSEPNSGSDLASLKTTAVRDGDHYIVNGTKMWTTEAHWADWMHCLVRTDKEVKPQAGISFLLIDMTTPGIDIRPIVTIDGQHHTNQVFLDNVRVPAENLVGEEGQGWTIAKFLLANERVAIADTGPKIRLLRKIRAMFAAEIAAGRMSGARREVVGDRLASAEIRLAALVAMEEAYVRAWAAGGPRNGPEASVLKVCGTEVLQELAEIALLAEGPLGAVHDPHDLHIAPGATLTPAQAASAMAHQYLYSRCWSIFGGTNEIQRNLIAGALLA